MTRWFTSDWHLGHQNIIDFAERPFDSVEEMDNVLIARFNEVVGIDDEVYFLGDMCMGRLEESLAKIKRLTCRNLFLIPGNHDRVHRMHPKRHRFLTAYADAGFTVLEEQVWLAIGDQLVLLCHFPFDEPGFHRNPNKADRYSAQRPDDVGQWLLHGHTHLPSVLNGRQIHVGTDAHNFFPVPENVVADWITANR